MKHFLKKILVFATPVLLISAIPVGTFYLLDPFKVLYEYDEFNNSVVDYNIDYITTERFLKNEDVCNSYIFGSSRAGLGFMVEDWKEQLNERDEAFSFAVSNESIFGILGKMRLINEMQYPLDNAILVLDTDFTMTMCKNSAGHIFIKHPRVSKESESAFILTHLKDYIFTGFFVRYLDYKIFQKERPYMDGFLNFKHKDPNEAYIAFDAKSWEEEIRTSKQDYYEELLNDFYPRISDDQICEKVIDPIGKRFLEEIKDIFVQHGTDFKIVISPLYDQRKLSQSDLHILSDIFGSENVFDFSGRNAFTDDKYNYYEPSHYRCVVGDDIIQHIYKDHMTQADHAESRQKTSMGNQPLSLLQPIPEFGE